MSYGYCYEKIQRQVLKHYFSEQTVWKGELLHWEIKYKWRGLYPKNQAKKCKGLGSLDYWKILNKIAPRDLQLWWNSWIWLRCQEAKVNIKDLFFRFLKLTQVKNVDKHVKVNILKLARCNEKKIRRWRRRKRTVEKMKVFSNRRESFFEVESSLTLTIIRSLTRQWKLVYTFIACISCVHIWVGLQ